MIRRDAAKDRRKTENSTSRISPYQDIQTEFQGVEGLLVIRRYIVDNEFTILTGSGASWKGEFTYDPYQALEKNRFNRIYDSGTVSAYLR